MKDDINQKKLKHMWVEKTIKILDVLNTRSLKIDAAK